MLATVTVLLTVWSIQETGALVNRTSPTGKPRDCHDLLHLDANTYEGHYAVYAEPGAPNKATIIYCSQYDGMKPLPRGVSREPERNCLDHLQVGHTKSGPRVIYPYLEHPNNPVLVYCDQDTDGGGWSVIQQRYDGSEDFYLSYSDYADGFGNVAEEHYLGNNIIHAITSQSTNELRVDLVDWDNLTTYAHYQSFFVDSAAYNYQLVAVIYNGDAGDSLHYHNGNEFTTFDVDNDEYDHYNCADKNRRRGGWWYGNCGSSSSATVIPSNLNGYYYSNGNTNRNDGMWWGGFHGSHYSLMKTQMMVRPYSCNVTTYTGLHAS